MSRSAGNSPSTIFENMSTLNNKVTLQLNGNVHKNTTLNIYDLQGRIIRTVPAGELKSGSNVIDLSNQARGMYIPVIEGNGGSISKKMIIK